MKEYMEIGFEIDTKNISEDGTFSGFGSTFGGEPDSYGDVVLEGAFKKSLEKGGRNGFGISMLWQHDAHQPIGTWLSLVEMKKGLKVEGKLSLGVQKADEALILMKDGALRGLSIGYRIPKGGSEYDSDKDIRYLKEIDLWEISPVTFPANTRAQIMNVKEIGGIRTERELEAYLRDSGLSRRQAIIIAGMCVPYLGQIREQEKSLNSPKKFHSDLIDVFYNLKNNTF